MKTICCQGSSIFFSEFMCPSSTPSSQERKIYSSIFPAQWIQVSKRFASWIEGDGKTMKVIISKACFRLESSIINRTKDINILLYNRHRGYGVILNQWEFMIIWCKKIYILSQQIMWTVLILFWQGVFNIPCQLTYIFNPANILCVTP